MKISLTLRFIIPFLALTFVMHEAHEIAHTAVGRIICGCWGERDFNVWGLCEGCYEKKSNLSLIPTFAGPIFTFIILWIGAWLLKKKNSHEKKSLGLAIIFGSLTSARIVNALLGMGDEIFAINKIIENHSIAWIIGLSAILVITVYPLYKAYITIENKRPYLWFSLFFLMPFVIDVAVVLIVLNSLLEKNILSDYWILGSPMIVSLWTFFVTAVLSVTWKGLYKLKKKGIGINPRFPKVTLP